MDQHPVPRQITSFEFQLVGQLTVKQFGYLAVGCMLAVVLFFLTPKVLFLNWVAAAIPVIIALGFAFVPVNERPMEVWLSNLIKRLVTPTQFYYHKHNKPPAILLGVQLPPKEVLASYLQAKQKLAEYEFTTKKKNPMTDEVALETIRLNRIKKVQESMESAHNDKFQMTNSQINDKFTNEKIQTQARVIGEHSPLNYKLQISNFKLEEASPPSSLDKLGTTADEGGMFTIMGTVVSTNNIPLPSMVLYLKRGNETVRIMKTNAQGAFVNAIPLPDGDYSLQTEDPLKKYTFATMIVNHGSIPVVVKGQRI